MTAKAKERALSVNLEPGFLWKIWTQDVANERPGGIYCFDTIEHANKYMQMHEARLKSAGALDIQFKILSINEELTHINHGPI